jgi:peptidoglycan/LPS O-acetylase OafA/YrhL
MTVKASQSGKHAASPGKASRKAYRAALIPVAIIMLVFWAIMTFAFDGPGWVHIFLSLGVFLLIWGVVERGGGTRRRD